MKTADINVLYFKQGDDLSEHLKDAPTPVAALEAHAEQLDEAAAMLRKIGEIVSAAVDVDIQAETHMITISGPNDVIDQLITQDLATLADEEEEYEEYQGDDDDEEEAAEFSDRGMD